ncbi:tandem C2 domains nuclear protein isoform X2 [Salmo trutta]|uniref:tandem C2 domains nuclear protein isoform X2 n=1 Tax=Salmo trutta TaxID=8032 RepID=UPI0011318287|nr:tandem C2 domains nuclear protein-like isoform X2 [Salmo trutta]
MAMECINSCFKSFLGKDKAIEQQVITVKMSPARAISGDPRKSVGVSEDYLLSKLPPGGKGVPFVIPTFKPSYVQPPGSRYLGYLTPWRHTSSAYADRKAELSGANHIVYNPDSSPNMCPGTTPHSTLEKTPCGSGGNMKTGRQSLSKSMFDLSNSSPHNHIQRYDSVSNVQSSSASSSKRDSLESSRSLESITLSGDEREQRELGKVCVRLSYQEALEQVWITLVQCKDVSLVQNSSEQQKISFKGIITMSKPVQFKSSIKEGSPDTVFMETFVFTLRLQQLRCCALVFRLQTHHPRKRTVAECVLSLRQLGPEETQHWMELSPPSKTTVCRAELHLATCFQRLMFSLLLQVCRAELHLATCFQRLMFSLLLQVCHAELHLATCFQRLMFSLLLQVCRAELHLATCFQRLMFSLLLQVCRAELHLATCFQRLMFSLLLQVCRAELHLATCFQRLMFSLLLQVCHAELHLATCFQPVNGRIQLQVLAAQNLPAPLSQAFFVKIEMQQLSRVVMKKKTHALKSSGGQLTWTESFYFPLALDQSFLLSVKLYSRSSVRRKHYLGQVHLGFDSPTQEAAEQWRDSMSHPEKVVAVWHRLNGCNGGRQEWTKVQRVECS